MKHIKPVGYSESRESGDGIHCYEVIVGEKKHYCSQISSCDRCHKMVRFWCKAIKRIENYQEQIIANNRLNVIVKQEGQA